MRDRTHAPESVTRVFPRWMSHRVPIFAELESNPLYLFFTGRAYGKRRWWRVGGRPGGFQIGDPRSLRRFLGVVCFAGAFLIVGLGGPGIVGFPLLLFAIVGGIFFGQGGSVQSFLEREHKAGRLEALALIPQTSRDWTLAWLGTRVLLRPGFYAILLGGAALFWPVFSLVMRHSDPLLQKNVSLVGFVIYPSLAGIGFLLVAVFYRVGSETMGLYFELASLVQSPSRDRITKSIGDLFGYILHATVAWGVPVVVGLLGRALGELLLTLVAGNNEGWQTPIQFAGFAGGYVASSCFIQIQFIRPYWHGALKIFLPALRENVFRLEEKIEGPNRL